MEHNSVLNWDDRLSRISLRLSRRFHQCEAVGGSRQKKGNPPCLDTNTAFPPHNDASWSPELFGSALQDISEFLDIIRSCCSKESTNAYAHLGTVAVLNILSAYLQIVTIYDLLLKCLWRQLVPSSSSCSSVPSSPTFESRSGEVYGDTGFQILPGLEVAGFIIKQSNLQVKILIDVMVEQFSTLERLLGLPTELRVSTKQKRSQLFQCYHGEAGRHDAEEEESGLFKDNKCAKALLTTMFQSGDKSGFLALSSLQEMTEKLQRLVNT